MSNGDAHPHKPRDVVNGHVLTSEGHWVQLNAQTAPAVPPPHTPDGGGYAVGQPGPPWHHGQTIYVQADNSNNTSLAPVTSLITGLIGLSVCRIPIIGIIGWIFGPLALIFGAFGARRGKSEHKIMSWIGIACGVLTLMICVVYFFIFVAAFSDSSS